MWVRVKTVNISIVGGGSSSSSSSSSSSINDTLLSHNASTRFEVVTAVISKA
jgi:hypothetical protein